LVRKRKVALDRRATFYILLGTNKLENSEKYIFKHNQWLRSTKQKLGDKSLVVQVNYVIRF
jgi:hypothetical protein